MLNYLATSLPSGTGAPARLLALQCVLRTSASGHVRLPAGLLRGMRLPRGLALWQELEDTRWLRLQPSNAPKKHGGAVAAQILDDLTAIAARHERTRAAGWALQVACSRHLRGLDATGRLAAITLASYTATEHLGRWDGEQLLHICGLTTQNRLDQLLHALTTAGFLSSWAPARDGDICWRLSDRPPEQSAKILGVTP
ncbi:hypothetical protein [Streptomyces sp. NPDC091212]|uniref:hypothetical protein n=1 Tax=Streptomyces sp. NPDC091212 TaxID=3155191 RepID=UPI003412B3D6